MHEIDFDWFSENREHLIANIQNVKLRLKCLVSDSPHPPSFLDNSAEPKWMHGDPLPALEALSHTFHLSNFEKSILVLCAGAEIDGEMSALCSKFYENAQNTFPTFDIALKAFPDANWEAILPESNLRRFQLVVIRNYDDIPLITTPIRINERILHYLLGFRSAVDITLDYLIRPVRMTAPLAESMRENVLEITETYSNCARQSTMPVFNLWGHDPDSGLIVAQRACEELALGLWNIPAELFPSKSPEEQSISGLLSRECFLTGNALYLNAYDTEETIKKLVMRFAGRSLVPLLFIGSREPLLISSEKPSFSIELRKPTKEDQREMWRQCFDSSTLNEHLKKQLLAEINEISDRFSLNAVAIDAVCRKVALSIQGSGSGVDKTTLYAILRASIRRIAKSKLGDLAEEIVPGSRLDDVVLPASRKNMLRSLVLHFRQRHRVYDEWGFAKKNARGLGIIALFSGESGTGKTMAAEGVANELGIDLYRIDLSMVASKYIGDTEKNLRQIFDAAETKECILFFDEADALFGKRSEVKDSHDRYANMQVGYLLQRIESHNGIVILATNFKKSLDSAFTRRVRFIIDFPFPDEKSREQIWRRIFPNCLPVGDLDYRFLSKLSISGASIRNIAMNAAFLAAEDDESLSMTHLRIAAEEEYNKLGRGMAAAEIGSWPS